jgi:FKBP-type peptidyl-prolyl cis-trans isomerase FklB
MGSRCAAAFVVLLLPATCLANETVQVKDAADRSSYSLGHQIGGDLERQATEIDADFLLRGLGDALSGTAPSIPPEEIQAILVGLKRKIETTQREQMQRMAEKHRVEGEEFLAANVENQDPDREDEEPKLSYSIGYQVGGDFKRQGLEIDPELVVKGVLDAQAGSEPLMTSGEMRETLTELKQQATAAAEQQREEQARKNLADGESFLAENAEQKGVRTLPSGLQYQVLSEGEGSPPAATDTVTVQYRGTLIDGREFDSSYARGEPATFPLDRVIPGWTEGLQLMRPGAKYRLFVPSQLAYGERGAPPKIGPNTTLVFEVELLSVQRAE